MAGPPHIAPADPHPRPPGWAVKRGGWDTHAHVFGPVARFPFRDGAAYTAPDETGEDYLRTLDALGVEYGVLVQPSVYGQDNRCLVAALRAHPGRLVGVVDLDVLATCDGDLEDLTRAGVRGLRIRPAGVPADTLARIVARLREVGWRLDVLVEDTAAVGEIAALLRALKVEVVIEAMGNPKAGQPVSDPGFQALLALLRDGVAWAKLSHAYHIDLKGPPYEGTVPFARALVEAAPDRLVWGSDWPHPMRGGVMPNDGALMDLLLRWAVSVELANRILCDNPLRFFGPPPAVPARGYPR